MRRRARYGVQLVGPTRPPTVVLSLCSRLSSDHVPQWLDRRLMSVRHQSEAQARHVSSVRIVVWLGILLLLVGFMTMLPRGLTPGGAAHRNVPLGGVGGLVSTPGYQREEEDTARRRTIVRLLMGAVLLGAGLVCTLVAG